MSGAPVKDQRFQKVHNDPRFARNSKRRNKLQIDQRFAGVFKDARFQSGQGKYDKYGRRVEKKTNELKKFYRLEEEDDDDDDKTQEKEAAEDDDDDDEADDEEKPASSAAAKNDLQKSSSRASSTSDDDEATDETIARNDEKLSRLEYLNRMARGELANGRSSDSDDSDDDSDDDDADADALASEPESEKEDVPLGEETKRFAVQNCDWSRIRAVDLLALFQSFAPATGAVHDVTIYPSNFGLQKMKEEEQFGPQGLWRDKKPATGSDSAGVEDGKEEADDSAADDADDDDNEDEKDGDDDAYDSDDPLGVKKRVDASEANGFDSEKLRKYELQKLKYYYAVVTCDSVKTASAIFDSCDQLEYETSANLLDLRYVPDDVAFTNPPKDVCTRVPDAYKPSLFATTALQNTDVKLTWEEDDESRLELLTRQAEWKNADDNDFSAYLASDNSSDGGDSDDDSDNDNADNADSADNAGGDKKKAAKLKQLKSRYRKMLLGSDAEDESGDSDDNNDNKNDSGADSDSDSGDDKDDAGVAAAGGGDMEMTFTPGAGDVLKAKRQREREEQETPFERYAREKKQQKNLKLHEKRARQKELEREQKAVLKAKGRGGAGQAKLLREAIADTPGDGDSGDDDDRNFDLKTIQKSEKVKGLKGKRRAKELRKLGAKTGLQHGFAFDAADPRFGALYAKGSRFQLDPTDPKFRKTEANDAIFKERRKRTELAGNAGARPATVATTATATVSAAPSELKAMVENLKRKAQQPKPTKPHAAKKQRF
ncbi:hypothetical protein PybrP1_000181 [[Pythium] brassicae (nom. inval.)]|nr:hypothetical protein PybrP1_000181 [[Pythium] brassicae (nom. inval.)]